TDSQPESEKPSYRKALEYMGFEDGEAVLGKPVDYVFIGSCTNSRIEDLRQVATLVQGKKKADGEEVWIVPGSKQVEGQAKAQKLDQVFWRTRFLVHELRFSACSRMNKHEIPAGKYCICTSNGSFERRQAQTARTLLVSRWTAAGEAITDK